MFGNWDLADTETAYCIATLKFYCDSVKELFKHQIPVAWKTDRKESFRRTALAYRQKQPDWFCPPKMPNS